MQVHPVVRRRLYQEVSDRIEEMIRSGELADGESLPSERELGDRFQVGRPAIREALLSLQQKGFVVLGSGERARVLHPDAGKVIEALSSAAQLYLSKPDGIKDFQSGRRLFESALAREAARVASDEDCLRIEAAFAANKEARGDQRRFETTDVAFHLEIVRTARSPLLTGVHQAMSGWLTEQRQVSLTAPHAEEAAFLAHELILWAILARDCDAAEAAMQSHLDSVADYYWAVR